MKCIMIVDENLPRGIIANTTAALGISLASIKEGLVGKQLKDKDRRIHEGITNTPIPILALDNKAIKKLYDQIQENGDDQVQLIGFNNVAQKSQHYEDYESKLLKTPKDDIEYLGMCLYGPKKKINKLTGSIKMLK
ncbi:Protein of unknown function [Dethiosulfatibacter aminovorans DSM 17477]|uniref:DUF2000 domain-containing protein n=1 Tax=Dethiosulfatibacter aminovorans DSM 17477 TaxID=1121476 RepID=A0A1M6MGT7_9FIRM|nr:DUF2000 domain-containing protein [Dethiosulfatibacter aminovorans]SHJ82699.1 Protein of unknown function [Dethiosulfatibacter aminovorans DSM 17477]